MQPPLHAIDSDEKFEAAIEAIQKRTPVPRAEWDAMAKLEREAAFTVSHVTEADVLQQVLDSLEAAVRQGTDFEQFKDEVYLKLLESWGGERPGQLETIFRTNLMTAYNEGRHAIISAPTVKRARPYWRFDATMDDRTSDECAECDGTVLPADDPFWTEHTPPLHFNCRSVLVPLSDEEAEDEGVDDEGPDADADEGFGEQPSEDGENWDFNLDRFDPDLRQALEELLDGYEP
jgi:SPP1 gp7 family putative phage head morphogenesis protein